MTPPLEASECRASVGSPLVFSVVVYGLLFFVVVVSCGVVGQPAGSGQTDTAGEVEVSQLGHHA